MLRSRSLVSSAVVVLVALSAVACNRVRVEPVRGPDGSSEWQAISCSHMDKKCFRTAAQLCPNGYYFARGAGPMPGAGAGAGEDDVAGGRTVAAAPPPQAGINAKTLPPQERWGSGMYTRKGGTILVQCAEVRATASR